MTFSFCPRSSCSSIFTQLTLPGPINLAGLCFRLWSSEAQGRYLLGMVLAALVVQAGFSSVLFEYLRCSLLAALLYTTLNIQAMESVTDFWRWFEFSTNTSQRVVHHTCIPIIWWLSGWRVQYNVDHRSNLQFTY